MKTYKQNGARIIEAPVKDFAVALVDKAKKQAAATNYCSGGFFATFKPLPKFTLPVGHLVADYLVTDQRTGAYCAERGVIVDGKIRYRCGHWDERFYNRAVSTFCVADGKASIRKAKTLPACDYAIPGIPVLCAGKPVGLTEVLDQGWDLSPMRASYHIFLGLKADQGTVFAVGLKTTSKNLISSGEAARKLAALGLVNAIKLDGGGSYYVHAGGVKEGTLENRRINTILTFGGNPYPAPTRTLKRGRRGEDVKWLQWHLNAKGARCDIDGAFGPGTENALRTVQFALGLDPDGSCGPITREAVAQIVYNAFERAGILGNIPDA